MSNAKTFAESELSLLSRLATDPENRPTVEEFAPEIIALCHKFGESGQSGGSAPYTASAICGSLKKLLLFMPIAPLTGEESEWNDISAMGIGEPMLQNNRCSAVFKQPNGLFTYNEAVVWKTQTGDAYMGSAFMPDGTKIRSGLSIKKFPFTPKTFTIDVVEKEVSPDDWEFYVKDESQLTEVFELYDRRG